MVSYLMVQCQSKDVRIRRLFAMFQVLRTTLGHRTFPTSGGFCTPFFASALHMLNMHGVGMYTSMAESCPVTAST